MKQSWLTRAQWAVSPQIPSPGPPRADSAVISIRVCSRMWRKSHFSELLSGKVQDVVRKNTLEAAQVEVWAGGGRSHITKGNNRCSSDRGWRSNNILRRQACVSPVWWAPLGSEGNHSGQWRGNCNCEEEPRVGGSFKTEGQSWELQRSSRQTPCKPVEKRSDVL